MINKDTQDLKMKLNLLKSTIAKTRDEILIEKRIAKAVADRELQVLDRFNQEINQLQKILNAGEEYKERRQNKND